MENLVTLTAANGDLLLLTINDESCPTSTPGVFQGAGEYVVTGGTGRFANASGSGTFAGRGDLANELFAILLSGTISRPNQ